MKKSFVFLFLVIFLAGCNSVSNEGKESVEELNVEDEKVEKEGAGEKKDVLEDEKVEQEEVVEKNDAVEEKKVEVKDITNVDDFSVSSSSVLVDNTNIGFNYEPEMVSDKDFSTAWCVASDDDFRKITFNFNEPVKAVKFGIVSGFARDEKIYAQNNRVKKIKLIFDGDEDEIFDFEDIYGMQFLKFDEKEFKTLDFVIEESFEGSKYDDTCIAEIDFKSDYVLNEDAGAALNYYKKYKADFALRPYDIVSGIVVSEKSNDQCGRPVKSAWGSYYQGSYSIGFAGKIYVTAMINQFGKEGDKLEMKWYQDQKPVFVEEELPAEWVLFFDEELEVVKGCDGLLYASGAVTFLDDYGFEGIWPLGYHKIQFFRDGKMIQAEKIWLSQ